jgi:hypothetical protein
VLIFELSRLVASRTAIRLSAKSFSCSDTRSLARAARIL